PITRRTRRRPTGRSRCSYSKRLADEDRTGIHRHRRTREPVTRRRSMTDAAAGERRVISLADGSQMPMLGLGVWQVRDGQGCVSAVRWALELGYRHIDTAQAYGNETSVGDGLRESGVPRDQVFITTKFYPARKDP